MNKYTRSMNKLSACIKDILSASDLSIDTKSILLVLAVTMSKKKLKTFLAPLSALNRIYAALVEINAIRATNGAMFRDYVIITALHEMQHDANSDELQRIISDANSSAKNSKTQSLQPALNKSQTLVDLGGDLKPQTPEFALSKQKTMNYLLENLDLDHKNQLNILIDAYLQNRLTQDPISSYTTLSQAMTDIFVASGFDVNYSKLYSSKIVTRALSDFMHDTNSSPRMLHAYNSYQ